MRVRVEKKFSHVVSGRIFRRLHARIFFRYLSMTFCLLVTVRCSCLFHRYTGRVLDDLLEMNHEEFIFPQVKSPSLRFLASADITRRTPTPTMP